MLQDFSVRGGRITASIPFAVPAISRLFRQGVDKKYPCRDLARPDKSPRLHISGMTYKHNVSRAHRKRRSAEGNSS
jgi:hypothetical protein